MNLLLDIWKSVRKRLVLVLAIPILAGIATAAISFYFVTPLYQAQATILVQPQNADTANMYTSVLGNQQMLKTYAELIKSHRIAAEVASNVGASESVNQLLDKVEVNIKNGTLLLGIAVTDQDPAASVKYANEFARVISAHSKELVNAENILIVDEAQASEHPVPVSPQPYQSTGVAVVLGLLGGVALALFAELVQRNKQQQLRVHSMQG
ncbi:YveK family protein [Brevibacillus migulae]|uniref:YveK family protein n=1 Tax=Brevibacillus migulae TaxID=1644114 RepID=UPI00106E7F0D|nr:Wzz/FepE/Etk N-terminal domain-containing protein [Brevibacillus migulae]